MRILTASELASFMRANVRAVQSESVMAFTSAPCEIRSFAVSASGLCMKSHIKGVTSSSSGTLGSDPASRRSLTFSRENLSSATANVRAVQSCLSFALMSGEASRSILKASGLALFDESIMRGVRPFLFLRLTSAPEAMTALITS